MLQFELFEIQYMDGGILVIISGKVMLNCIEILRICEDVKYRISRILKIKNIYIFTSPKETDTFSLSLYNTLSRTALGFSAGPAGLK